MALASVLDFDRTVLGFGRAFESFEACRDAAVRIIRSVFIESPVLRLGTPVRLARLSVLQRIPRAGLGDARRRGRLIQLFFGQLVGDDFAIEYIRLIGEVDGFGFPLPV
jgi:hypothetical protein